MSTSTAANASDPLAALAPLIQILEKEFDLANAFGAYLMCTCLGCMLFGLTMHQTFRYFRMYPKDLPGYKLLVLGVLLLDLFHTVTSVHITYFYLATNYFHPIRLIDGVWSIRLIVAETGGIIVVTHSFYARRLFLLGGRNVWPIAFIAIFVSAEFALSIVAAVKGFTTETLMGFEDWTWLLYTILSIAVFVDVVATSLLIYHLRNSRTGFKKTDSTVDVLMVYGINTGLSTSVVTGLALICAIVMPKNMIYSAVLVVATKMYANSLLAVLNSRRSIVDRGQGQDGVNDGSFGLKVLNTVRECAPGNNRRATHEIEFNKGVPSYVSGNNNARSSKLTPPQSFMSS